MRVCEDIVGCTIGQKNSICNECVRVNTISNACKVFEKSSIHQTELNTTRDMHKHI